MAGSTTRGRCASGQYGLAIKIFYRPPRHASHSRRASGSPDVPRGGKSLILPLSGAAAPSSIAVGRLEIMVHGFVWRRPPLPPSARAYHRGDGRGGSWSRSGGVRR